MTNVTISKARYEELMKKAGVTPISQKEGSKLVAEKTAAIKNLLKEIKEVVELSGVQVKLGYELEEFVEEVDSLHPNWQSSSYHC
jgi:hypothetical protein